MSSDQEKPHASARGENPSNGSESAKVFPQDRHYRGKACLA
jgi:hypothetical protein